MGVGVEMDGGAISKTLPLRRNVNLDCPCDVSR